MQQAVAIRATAPRITKLSEQAVAVVRVEAAQDEFPARIADAFCLTSGAITASGAAIAGPPFSRYLELGDRIVADVGFPFAGAPRPTEGVRVTALPAGRMVTTTHVGPYEEIEGAWHRGLLWMREHEIEPTGPGWECYLTDPEDPGPPVTAVYWPID